MSCTLQKHVFSLFKPEFSRKLAHVNSVRVICCGSQAFHPRTQQSVHDTNKSRVFFQSECLRPVTANVRTLHFATPQSTLSSKDESRELMAVWPDVVRDLTDAGRYTDIPDVTKWLAKVLQYNVPRGKKMRALALVNAYKTLAPEHELTQESLRLARILGWCVELVQSFLLILDDIQDGSTYRRDQLCWYKNENVGLLAINDGVLVETCIYSLLRMHFKNHPCYTILQDLFLETTLKTIFGQSLDMLSTGYAQKKPDFKLFTMDRYSTIVKYKTAYYTYFLPVTAAMYLSGTKDPEVYRQAKTILLEMGHYFQVQDDYLDCYGDKNLTGKVGTDIAQGKCSWLVVMALQRATPQQRKIIEENYGIEDEEKVRRVVEVYNEIGLPNTYSLYEEETYNLLNTHIQQISRGLPHELFYNLLKLSYQRQK